MAERPSDEEIAKWNRWFAIEGNNAAWTLTEIPDPTEEQRLLMLRTAFSSVHHWYAVGNEKNIANADLLLARACAVARLAELATTYAKSAANYFLNNDSADWELAFVHALLADSAALSGDAATHVSEYQMATEYASKLTGEDRAIFDATFNLVAAP